MTIAQAIAKINELKPNTYSISDKVRWLSILDGMIKEEIIDTHERTENDYTYTDVYTEVPNDADMPSNWATTYNTEYYVQSGTDYILNTEADWNTALALPIYTKSERKDYKYDFNGYDDNTDESTELLVPSPYDDIYVKWLEAQIDYSNSEMGKYNNSMTMFNSAYATFNSYFNKHHMPLGVKFRYW